MLFDSIQARKKEIVLEGQEHVIEGISVLNQFLSESVRYDEEIYNLKANVLDRGLSHSQSKCTSDEFSTYVNNSSEKLGDMLKNMHRSVFTSVQKFEEFLQKAEIRFYSNCGNISRRNYSDANISTTLIDYRLDKDTLTKYMSYVDESIMSKLSSATVDCCTTGANSYQFAYRDICNEFDVDLERIDLSLYRLLRDGESQKDVSHAESIIGQLCDFNTDYEIVESVYNTFESVYYRLQGILNSGAFIKPDFANSFNFSKYSAVLNDYMNLFKFLARFTLHVIEAVVERRNSYEHALVYEIMRGE